MRIGLTLPVLLMVVGVAGQAAVPPATGDPIPARVRATIERELELIGSAKADWTLRRNAAASLVALAGNPAKSGFVVRLVSARHLRSSTTDTAQILLSVLGRIPAKPRERNCELVIAELIDDEARLRKASSGHVMSVTVLQRLDMLLAYCSEDRAYTVRNRIQREPWHAGIVTLYDGVFSLLRDYTSHPHGLAVAKKIATIVSGTKPEIRRKIDAYLSSRYRKKIPPSLAKRIDRVTKSFVEPPDILRQYDLSLNYADLSFTCPLMTAWDQIKKIRPVPRVDSDPAALRAFLTGPMLDKYDSNLRESVLGLIGSRADVAKFFPMLCDAFERVGYPRIYRHTRLDGAATRLPAAAADHLVHLAAARAILFAVASGSAEERAPFRGRYRAALSYLRRHGTPPERRAAAARLGPAKFKK